MESLLRNASNPQEILDSIINNGFYSEEEIYAHFLAAKDVRTDLQLEEFLKEMKENCIRMIGWQEQNQYENIGQARFHYELEDPVVSAILSGRQKKLRLIANHQIDSHAKIYEHLKIA